MAKRKLKICDYNGSKLDVATISTDADVKKAVKNWKLKGLFD